jgi:hypothetical protein
VSAAANTARAGRAFVLGLFMCLACLARPAAALAGIDDQPPAVEGPWIIEVGPDVAVVVDEQGRVGIVGDAEQRVRDCKVNPGCTVYWDDGVGLAVIPDQSPAPASPAPTSPAAAPSAAASVGGAAPR